MINHLFFFLAVAQGNRFAIMLNTRVPGGLLQITNHFLICSSRGRVLHRQGQSSKHFIELPEADESQVLSDLSNSVIVQLRALKGSVDLRCKKHEPR